MDNFSIKEIEGIHNYLINIYPQKECSYVKIFNKSKRYSKFISTQDLKNKDTFSIALNSFPKNDLMISSNTFKSVYKATANNIFAINIICVDIDYKSTKLYCDLTPKQIINLLELDYFGTLIPDPNFIEYGNQIRLIYKLSDTVYVPKHRTKVKILCDRISEVFANTLKEFGAEKQSCEKFIRVPFSINTKSEDEVKVISYSKEEYSLCDMKDLWLDELPKWYGYWKSKNKKRNRRKKRYNIDDFNKQRLKDFEKIQSYLNKNDINDYRSRLCFLYMNYSILSLKNDKSCKNVFEEAQELMLSFNNKFNYPLRENKLLGDTKFLRYKTYTYSNKKIIEFLNLDDNILKSLNSIFTQKDRRKINEDYYRKNKKNLLKKQSQYYIENRDSIKSNKKIYYKEHKSSILNKNKETYLKTLKENKKLTRQEKKELLLKNIQELRNEDLTQKEIAERLNISVKTVSRYLKLS